MTSTLLTLTTVFLLVSAVSSKMYIDTLADFEEMVKESENMGPKTTYTPPVDEAEIRRWERIGAKQAIKIDMSNRPCDQRVIFALMSACGEITCPTGRQHLVEDNVCHKNTITDPEIQGVCCPEKLRTGRLIPTSRSQ